MRQASQSIIVIAQHRLLRILDEEFRERLASIANLRDYDANEVLYHEGEDATDVWIVVRGQIELVKLTAKGAMNS
jgi:CRP-like cAMP-binding protein